MIKVQLTENHVFRIADNGCGFDLEEKLSNSTGFTGYGLSGMQYRTDLCDGKFGISSEKQKGTTVHISLPLDNDLSVD
jgi:two-component system sensor histidine kinase NreB